MVEPETEPMPLGGDRREHRRYWRFDPTVSMGTLMQLLGLVLVAGGAWATYQSDKATQRLEIEQMKANLQADRTTSKEVAAADRLATKEQITELKADVRKMQDTLAELNVQLARFTTSITTKGKP